MKNKFIVLTFLFFICNYSLFSMEIQEMKTTDRSPTDINQLPIELLQLILIQTWIVYSDTNLTTLKKIIKLYQSIKQLSFVCKRFRSLEDAHLTYLKEELRQLLAEFSMDEEHLISFKQLVSDTILIKSSSNKHNYLLIRNWLFNEDKSIDLLKATLILLRFNYEGKTEKEIFQDIWSKFESQESSPLHLACKKLNIEMVKYLINPKIRSFFNIDINLKKLNKTPLMSIPKETKKNKKERDQIIELISQAAKKDPQALIEH